MHDLQSIQASLTVTTEKLISMSFALDFAVVQVDQMEIQLKAAEEKMKTQGQQLESTQTTLSKREFSSSVVISLVVANAMALVKNHMPDFDAEILWKEFTVDDTEREVLVDSAYDTAQHFVSLYDFSMLPGSDDIASLGIL
jgi:hypothetical protein